MNAVVDAAPKTDEWVVPTRYILEMEGTTWTGDRVVRFRMVRDAFSAAEAKDARKIGNAPLYVVGGYALTGDQPGHQHGYSVDEWRILRVMRPEWATVLADGGVEPDRGHPAMSLPEVRQAYRDTYGVGLLVYRSDSWDGISYPDGPAYEISDDTDGRLRRVQ